MGNSALIVVDMQNDFMPILGSLPVPDGMSIIPTINKYIEIFSDKYCPIVFTRDWHTFDHSSFKEYGGTWPVHCVRNTIGAELTGGLVMPDTAILISKASRPDKDAYSGFQDTKLAATLHTLRVTHVYVCGVATDYCVKATVLDALKGDFVTFLLTDAIKAVNLKKEDGRKAELEMTEKGATFVSVEQLTYDKPQQPVTN